MAAKFLRDRRKTARLSEFARSLSQEWKKLNLPADAKVVVAVSGGADSVALLLGLDELNQANKLKLRPVIAHLDHGLRRASRADARWVGVLGEQLKYEMISRRVNVRTRARKTEDNLEQAARRARYKFLAEVAKEKQAQLVVTAHTMDDQAETVLLNLLRGSGAEGLSGIDAVRSLVEGSKVLLARPLVSWARRADIENYCKCRRNLFLVDDMNADERFARVRVRKQLLPLMRTFNPRIADALARTADLLREDNQALANAASRLLELAKGKGKEKSGSRGNFSLSLDLLVQAPPALRRRALRQWIRQCRGDLTRLERVHVLAVETLLFGNRGGRTIELPGGAKVARKNGLLHYLP